jgi:hypothetical protein
MASTAQITANRANAAKSTGPRTAAGKSRSSQNNLRHGFRSGAILVNEEDPAFLRILAGHITMYAPSGPTQLAAVHRIAQHTYRQRLLEQMEDELLLNGRLLSSPSALGTLFAYRMKVDKEYTAAIREFREMQLISDVRTQSAAVQNEIQTYEPNWLSPVPAPPLHFQQLPSSAITLNWMYTWT